MGQQRVQPQLTGNRVRFLLTRALGLAGLLWLYSLEAQDRTATSPPTAAKAVPATPASPLPRITVPPTVKDFGATGDGVTDDTAAIQRAVDASLRPLHFPAGTYRLTKSIDVRLDKTGYLSIEGSGVARIVMESSGPAFRVTGTHSGTADPKTVQSGVWERQRAPMVDGIEIVGKHNEACGIELAGTVQATLSRLVIRNTLHAIHLTHRNRNVQISECHLYQNRGVGVYLDAVNLHQINIAGSHISYNRQGGVVCRDSEIRNLQITGCDIEANQGDGLLAANVLLDCRRGSVREGAITGCTLQHERDALATANIRLLGPASDKPLMVGTFTIGNNVISDVKVNIHLKNARGVVIEGNTLWEGFEQNILAENCAHLVISNNLMDRNPDQREETSKNGVELKNCTDCTLNALHLHDVHATSAAILLDHCGWCNVTNCHITDSGSTPIELLQCENCRVAGCMLRVPKDSLPSNSIRVTGGSSNLIFEDSR